MSYAVGECAQGQRFCWVSDWQKYKPIPPDRPWHVCLHASVKSCPVSAFCFATLKTRERQTTVSIDFTAKQIKRLTGRGRVVGKILSDGVLIEDYGHDKPGRRPGHSLALAVSR